MSNINHWDFVEVLNHVTGLPEDNEDEHQIFERLPDDPFEAACAAIQWCFDHVASGVSPLTGNHYVGFAKDGCFVLRKSVDATPPMEER